MKKSALTLEHAAYALALGLAFGIRLLKLGSLPLTDPEAQLALQALRWSQGGMVIPAPHPAYLTLSGISFFLLGASGFLARFWPAVLGTALVAVPYWLRDGLGRRTAIIFAFGLALDPALVAASRQIGSPVMVLGAAGLTLAFGYARKPILAGISLVVALLGGPGVIPGMLIVGLAYPGYRWLNMRWNGDQVRTEMPKPDKPFLRNGSVAAGLTFIALGTIFMQFPQALGGWMGLIPEYLQGWTGSPEVPIMQLLTGLVVYQFLPIVIILWGLVDPGIKFQNHWWLYLVWLVVSLIVTIIYPGRQMVDLIWVTVPLWGLAACVGDQLLEQVDVWKGPAAGLAVVVCIFLVLFWLTLLALFQSSLGPTLQWMVLIASLALVGVATALVYFQWGAGTARMGMTWGLAAGLGAFMVSNLWSAASLVPQQEVNLWHVTPQIDDAHLLVETLGDLSEFATGRRDAVTVHLAVDSPALNWQLRYIANVEQGSERQTVKLEGSPEIIITRQSQDSPSLTSGYRGQDFSWWVEPVGPTSNPEAWFNWIAFRDIPIQREYLILWARSDLFPDDPGSSDPESVP